MIIKKNYLTDIYTLQALFPFFYYIAFKNQEFWKDDWLSFAIAMIVTMSYFWIIWRQIKKAISSDSLDKPLINFVIGILNMIISFFLIYSVINSNWVKEDLDRYLNMFLGINIILLLGEIIIIQIIDSHFIKFESISSQKKNQKIKNDTSSPSDSFEIQKLPKWIKKFLRRSFVLSIVGLFFLNLKLFSNPEIDGIHYSFIHIYLYLFIYLVILTYITGTFRYIKKFQHKWTQVAFSVAIFLAYCITGLFLKNTLITSRYHQFYGIDYGYYIYTYQNPMESLTFWLFNLTGIMLCLILWINFSKFTKIMLYQTSFEYRPKLFTQKEKFSHWITSPFEIIINNIFFSTSIFLLLYFLVQNDTNWEAWIISTLLMSIYYNSIINRSRSSLKTIWKFIILLLSSILYASIQFGIITFLNFYFYQGDMESSIIIDLFFGFLFVNLVISFGLIYQRKITIHSAKEVESKFTENQQERIRCSNCNMLIDPNIISILQEEEFVYCKYCGEKIRKQEIFPVDEKDLLKEHAKIIKKLHQNDISQTISE
ncbi:hypothetical protein [Candidatus Harpocratesius sp.]